jgi:hypothetical protein
MSTPSRASGRRAEQEHTNYGVAPFPGPGSSVADREENAWWLEREIDMLRRALEDKGEMRRSDLGDLVGCKYWGPGRFAGALRKAVSRGAIEHTGFGRYGPAPGGGDAG